MKKLLILLTFILIGTFLFAEGEVYIEAVASKAAINFDAEEFWANGGLRVSYDDFQIQANRIKKVKNKNILICYDRVIFRQGTGDDKKIEADTVTLNLDDKSAEIRNGKTFMQKIYYGGKSFNARFKNKISDEEKKQREKDNQPALDEVDEFEAHVDNSYFTTCNLPETHYHFETQRIDFYDMDKIIAYNTVLYIGNIPVLWLPIYASSLMDNGKAALFPRFGWDKLKGKYVVWGMTYKISQIKNLLSGYINMEWSEEKGWAVSSWENPYYFSKDNGGLFKVTNFLIPKGDAEKEWDFIWKHGATFAGDDKASFLGQGTWAIEYQNQTTNLMKDANGVALSASTDPTLGALGKNIKTLQRGKADIKQTMGKDRDITFGLTAEYTDQGGLIKKMLDDVKKNDPNNKAVIDNSSKVMYFLSNYTQNTNNFNLNLAFTNKDDLNPGSNDSTFSFMRNRTAALELKQYKLSLSYDIVNQDAYTKATSIAEMYNKTYKTIDIDRRETYKVGLNGVPILETGFNVSANYEKKDELKQEREYTADSRNSIESAVKITAEAIRPLLITSQSIIIPNMDLNTGDTMVFYKDASDIEIGGDLIKSTTEEGILVTTTVAAIRYKRDSTSTITGGTVTKYLYSNGVLTSNPPEDAIIIKQADKYYKIKETKNNSDNMSLKLNNSNINLLFGIYGITYIYTKTIFEKRPYTTTESSIVLYEQPENETHEVENTFTNTFIDNTTDDDRNMDTKIKNTLIFKYKTTTGGYYRGKEADFPTTYKEYKDTFEALLANVNTMYNYTWTENYHEKLHYRKNDNRTNDIKINVGTDYNTQYSNTLYKEYDIKMNKIKDNNSNAFSMGYGEHSLKIVSSDNKDYITGGDTLGFYESGKTVSDEYTYSNKVWTLIYRKGNTTNRNVSAGAIEISNDLDTYYYSVSFNNGISPTLKQNFNANYTKSENSKAATKYFDTTIGFSWGIDEVAVVEQKKNENLSTESAIKVEKDSLVLGVEEKKAIEEVLKLQEVKKAPFDLMRIGEEKKVIADNPNTKSYKLNFTAVSDEIYMHKMPFDFQNYMESFKSFAFSNTISYGTIINLTFGFNFAREAGGGKFIERKHNQTLTFRLGEEDYYWNFTYSETHDDLINRMVTQRFAIGHNMHCTNLELSYENVRNTSKDNRIEPAVGFTFKINAFPEKTIKGTLKEGTWDGSGGI